jgi:hypothetical protein
VEVREQYKRQISNSFAALENLDDGRVINRTWKNWESTSISAKERLGWYE